MVLSLYWTNIQYQDCPSFKTKTSLLKICALLTILCFALSGLVRLCCHLNFSSFYLLGWPMEEIFQEHYEWRKLPPPQRSYESVLSLTHPTGEMRLWTTSSLLEPWRFWMLHEWMTGDFRGQSSCCPLSQSPHTLVILSCPGLQWGGTNFLWMHFPACSVSLAFWSCQWLIFIPSVTHYESCLSLGDYSMLN